MAGPELQVEIVYALPERQVLVPIRVAAGTTVGEAIRASGLLTQFPQIDPTRDALGIFGQRADPAQRLRDGDRVEIYRPLRVDPKETRRARARNGGAR